MASGGRNTVQTEAIVVQVWAVLNTKEEGGFWEGFPIADTNLEAIHENHLREGAGRQQVAV
jgi:hypothetical protein